MTTAVQRRRGTDTEHATFTGLDGEITVNTTTYTVHVHDGVTAGGNELALADGSNISLSTVDINGGTIDGTIIGAATPAAGTFSSLTATTADVNGGTIDGTVIGGTTAAAGTFTNVTGTLLTAAQPNVTSVGTLTGFTSTGIDDNATSTAITITAAEYVGINTTNPSNKLVVSNGGAEGLEVYTNDATYGTGFLSYNRSGAAWLPMTFRAGIDGYKWYSSGGVNTMSLTNLGNVGIGETVPDTLLHLKATDSTLVTLEASDTSVVDEQVLGGIQLKQNDASNASTDGGYVKFTGDGNFGGTNLDFATNALDGSGESLRMRIDSSGNVGIGVTPVSGAPLTVKTPNSAFAVGEVGNEVLIGPTSTSKALKFGNQVQSGTNTWMTINSSGNVGIGTSSPDRLLHVETATTTETLGTFRNASTTACTIDFQDANTTADNRVRIGCDTDDMVLYSGATETMRLDSSGNVGIGTASPKGTTTSTGTLQLGFGAQLNGRTGGLGSYFTENTYFVGDPGTTTGTIANSRAVGAAGASAIRFLGDATEFLRAGSVAADAAQTWSSSMLINSSGNVGIGATTADTALHVERATTSPVQFKLQNSEGSGTITCDSNLFTYDANQHLWNNAARSSEFMRIDSSGNLLVGTTDPGRAVNGFKALPTGLTRITTTSVQGLEMNRQGTDGNIVVLYNDNAVAGTISISGLTTAYNTSSDVRLKENITDAPSASSDIDAIQVRQFDWKADGSHQEYGFIAQELDSVAPYAVSKGETEDDTWGVDYSKLVPMMMKEIQELRARVAQLETGA